MTRKAAGPLQGLKIVEVGGIGPGPFCGMLLADLGADVVVIDRVQAGPQDREINAKAIVRRGKRAIALDLKTSQGVQALCTLLAHADGLIEGMRPGVMERLGVGPDECLSLNPGLVYGRVTGWGQHGPLAQAAGHDINYLALSGGLWYAGQPGEPPFAPPTLIGDVAGGGLYLAVGLLSGILHARHTGQGQVVDAAIVDGSAHMLNLLLGLHANGLMAETRGRGVLDGPPWYNTYRCADGQYISVGAVEPRFYALLREKLGLGPEDPDIPTADPDNWETWTRRFAAIFAQRDRAAWCSLLEGTDACFAPVLSPNQAAQHPHMRARGIYQHLDGALHAAPAPRFSATPADIPGAVPLRGEHDDTVLRDWCGGS